MNAKHTSLVDKLDCALALAATPHSVTLNKVLAVECRKAAAERDKLRTINVELLAALIEMMREFEPTTMYQGRSEPDSIILARAAIAEARSYQ